jgi:hypothetical protein
MGSRRDGRAGAERLTKDRTDSENRAAPIA